MQQARIPAHNLVRRYINGTVVEYEALDLKRSILGPYPDNIYNVSPISLKKGCDAPRLGQRHRGHLSEGRV